MRKIDALKKLAEKLGITTAGTIKGVTDAINVIAEGITIEGATAEKTMFEVKEYLPSSAAVIKDDGTVSSDYDDYEHIYDDGYTIWKTTPFIKAQKGDEWNCVNAYGFSYDAEKSPIERIEGKFQTPCEGFVRFCFLEEEFDIVKIQASSPGEIMSEYFKIKKEVENFEWSIKQKRDDGAGGIALKVGNIIDIQSMERKKVIRMDLVTSKTGVVLEIYEFWNGAISGKPPVGIYTLLDPVDPPDDIISEPICPNNFAFRILVKQAPECYMKDEDIGEYQYNAAELLNVTLYYEDGTKTTQRFVGSREAHKDIASLMTEIDILKGQVGGGA